MDDIVGISDSSGNLVASYTYDAWGKVTSVTEQLVKLILSNIAVIAMTAVSVILSPFKILQSRNLKIDCKNQKSLTFFTKVRLFYALINCVISYFK